MQHHRQACSPNQKQEESATSKLLCSATRSSWIVHRQVCLPVVSVALVSTTAVQVGGTASINRLLLARRDLCH